MWKGPREASVLGPSAARRFSGPAVPWWSRAASGVSWRGHRGTREGRAAASCRWLVAARDVGWHGDGGWRCAGGGAGWVVELARSPAAARSATCSSVSGGPCLGYPWVAGLGRGGRAQSEVPASGCGGDSLAAVRRRGSEGRLCRAGGFGAAPGSRRSNPGSEAAEERGCVRVRQRAGEEEEGGGGRRCR